MKATAPNKDARLAIVNEFRILCANKYPEFHKEYDFPVVRAPVPDAAGAEEKSKHKTGRFVIRILSRSFVHILVRPCSIYRYSEKEYILHKLEQGRTRVWQACNFAIDRQS